LQITSVTSPRIAKDAALVAEIEASLRTLPELDC
jgi:hypothetical protein